jgi:hypothetical protein
MKRSISRGRTVWHRSLEESIAERAARVGSLFDPRLMAASALTGWRLLPRSGETGAAVDRHKVGPYEARNLPAKPVCKVNTGWIGR